MSRIVREAFDRLNDSAAVIYARTVTTDEAAFSARNLDELQQVLHIYLASVPGCHTPPAGRQPAAPIRPAYPGSRSEVPSFCVSA